MQFQFRILHILVISIFISSCTSMTASFETPDNAFISPEGSGDSSYGRIGLSYGTQSKITLGIATYDTNSHWAIQENKSIETTNGFKPMINAAIIKT